MELTTSTHKFSPNFIEQIRNEIRTVEEDKELNSREAKEDEGLNSREQNDIINNFLRNLLIYGK